VRLGVQAHAPHPFFWQIGVTRYSLPSTIDPTLRPLDPASELVQGRTDSPAGGLEGFTQPQGAEWKPNEPIGADAELGRSLERVIQQLQWMQAQREAAAIDGVVLHSSLEELQLQGSGGSGNVSSAAEAADRTLLVLDTRIANWQQLVETIPERTELLLLQPDQSGLRQLSDLLSRQGPGQGYGALVLVVPAGQGSLALGSDQLRLP